MKKKPSTHKNVGREEAETIAIVAGPPKEQHPSEQQTAFKQEATHMLVMTDTQKSTCTIDPRNSKGNPAPVDGVPEWSTTNPSVVQVVPTANGMKADVIAVGFGDAQVNCVADADMDQGEIRELTATLAVQVRASEAVSMGMTSSPPVEQ